MKNFCIEAETNDLVDRDGLIVTVPAGLRTKSDLIGCYAAALRFPEYWDANWDAFADLLGDLHWLTERNIVITHSDVPPLENGRDQTIYLEILDDTVDLWRMHDAHCVSVVFPPSSEDALRQALARST